MNFYFNTVLSMGLIFSNLCFASSAATGSVVTYNQQEEQDRDDWTVIEKIKKCRFFPKEVIENEQKFGFLKHWDVMLALENNNFLTAAEELDKCSYWRLEQIRAIEAYLNTHREDHDSYKDFSCMLKHMHLGQLRNSNEYKTSYKSLKEKYESEEKNKILMQL